MLLLLRKGLGIGSSSVNARLVSLEDMEGKGGSDLLPGSASMAVPKQPSNLLLFWAHILKQVQIWLLYRNLMPSPRTILDNSNASCNSRSYGLD